MTAVNREAWLMKAVKPLAQHIEKKSGLVVPESVAVSVGWPGGRSFHKVIGQCWAQKAGLGVSQVFVSPLLVKPADVLATLTHELIHAADDNKSKHQGDFRRAWRGVGFEGKPTQSTPGSELALYLDTVVDKLGDYPHGGMNPGLSGRTPQTTRMLKLSCPECGCIVRTARKWLDEYPDDSAQCFCGTPFVAEG